MEMARKYGQTFDKYVNHITTMISLQLYSHFFSLSLVLPDSLPLLFILPLRECKRRELYSTAMVLALSVCGQRTCCLSYSSSSLWQSPCLEFSQLENTLECSMA